MRHGVNTRIARRNRKKDQHKKRLTETQETKNNLEMSFTQKKDCLCFCCEKSDHLSPECPEKDTRKKAEWFIYKAVNAYQTSNNKESTKSMNNDNDKEEEVDKDDKDQEM